MSNLKTKKGKSSYLGISIAQLCSVIALILGAFWNASAYAAIASCTVPGTGFQANSAWNIQQPANFTKGTVLASISMVLPITISNIRGGSESNGNGADLLLSWTLLSPYSGYDATTNSIPLATTTGIGGRTTIVTIDYGPLTSADALNHLPLVINPKSQADLVYASPPRYPLLKRYNGTTKYYAVYELVITDAAQYAASNIDESFLSSFIAAQPAPLINVYIQAHPDSTSSYENVYCFNGSNYKLTTLPPLPKLPRDLPTCQFNAGELNQTVTLSSATQSQVASQGSQRSAGAVGEKAFSITASGCGKGAVYFVYFTDALHTSSQQNYLEPNSGKKVGVRLYHSTETTPIPFGPTPQGSTLPPQAPIRYGNSSAMAGASYVMPFAAQYVRMPGADTVQTGPVTAMATVTIVYP